MILVRLKWNTPLYKVDEFVTKFRDQYKNKKAYSSNIIFMVPLIMKKFVFILSLFFLFSTSGYSLDREDLRKLMSKSKNDYGARLIEDACYSEDALLEIMYSKRCKCAIKAGKAGSDYAAREIADQCGL